MNISLIVEDLRKSSLRKLHMYVNVEVKMPESKVTYSPAFNDF